MENTMKEMTIVPITGQVVSETTLGFQTPNVPEGATADERRAIMFNALSNLDLSDKCEKRESNNWKIWKNRQSIN